MVLLYGVYLNTNQVKAPNYQCAPITNTVASQTVGVLKAFNVQASYVQHEEELSLKILVDGVYSARVIEGCNGISVIILFCAFVIAFPGNKKKAVLFCILGGLSIYVVNIFRIAILTQLLVWFPNQQVFLHNLVFPAIIYGYTFLLWVLWVSKFSTYKK